MASGFELNKIVSMVIGIAVAVIIVTAVLLPIINDAVIDDTDPNAAIYKTLLGVIGILVIVSIVLGAVRMLQLKD